MATSGDLRTEARGREAKGTQEAATKRKATKGRGRKGAADKRKAAGKNKPNAEAPEAAGAPEGAGHGKGVTEAAPVTKDPAGVKGENTNETGGGTGEISRKDLVQKALRKIRDQLDSKNEVTPATIGALEKLLKLDRDILEETEMPQEIRVLWEETDEDPEEDQ